MRQVRNRLRPRRSDSSRSRAHANEARPQKIDRIALRRSRSSPRARPSQSVGDRSAPPRTRARSTVRPSASSLLLEKEPKLPRCRRRRPSKLVRRLLGARHGLDKTANPRRGLAVGRARCAPVRRIRARGQPSAMLLKRITPAQFRCGYAKFFLAKNASVISLGPTLDSPLPCAVEPTNGPDAFG
jgi:hypothetical protein